MNATVRPMPEPEPPRRFDPYDGTTYYGRAQLKTAPFENSVVGGYIFLAGLSGAAAILAALAGRTKRQELAGVARRGRYLALLGPVLGAPLLIYDLHTPKRFLNMLRVAKHTSPMSIGTWILMAFSGFAGVSALAQAGADLMGADLAGTDRKPRWRWLSRLAQGAGVPAAVTGAGLSTYTATLLSATSTPVWAAAPLSLAARFGASSFASAAAALLLGERHKASRGKLAAVAAGALVVEAAATLVSHDTYEKKDVAAAFDGKAGAVEWAAGTGLGVAAPLGLLAVAAVLGRRRDTLSNVAAVAALAGSAALRISFMAVGDESAARPDVSFRFSTPENL